MRASAAGLRNWDRDRRVDLQNRDDQCEPELLRMRQAAALRRRGEAALAIQRVTQTDKDPHQRDRRPPGETVMVLKDAVRKTRQDRISIGVNAAGRGHFSS